MNLKLLGGFVILKPVEPIVYDNLYSKPTQSGGGANARHSMSVLFSVCGIVYQGQYDFVDCVWITLPGDAKKRVFPDRAVQYWFYPPNTLETFTKYAADVASGAIREDGLMRLIPYNPDVGKHPHG